MKYFTLIKQSVHPSTGEKIIPQEEMDMLIAARELLKKTEEETAALRLQEQEICQELRQEAEKKGFEEGLKRFNEYLVHFDAQIKDIGQQMLAQVIPIALQAAKKIVSKQIELHPETIVDIVRQTISPLTQNHHFKIYVNRKDKEILEKTKPEIKGIIDNLESLSIEIRDDITPGGCIIETDAGIVNATIENQWRALEAAFLKYTK